MLTVTIELSADGCLASFEASGHAGRARRSGSVPCAAASGLLRTAARVMHSAEGLVAGGAAGAPGEMRVMVSPDWKVNPEWLRGVTDFLIRGLRDLEAEFPREIAVRFR